MAREQAGDCAAAASQGQQPYNMCMRDEVGKTRENMDAYVAAFRLLLSSDLLKGFDEAQGRWSAYEQALCQAAFDQYKDGTIAPSEGSACELLLMRNHIRELGATLGTAFHR